MKRAVAIVRVLFGLMFIGFFVLGLTVDPPANIPDEARVFRDALLDSGFIFPQIFAVYLLVGLSWVTNRFAALTTVMLFPITLNVVLFHIVLVPKTLVLVLFVVVPQLFMLWVCSDSYRSLFRAKG